MRLYPMILLHPSYPGPPSLLDWAVLVLMALFMLSIPLWA